MNGLAFSWTVLTCVFKLAFSPNDLLQMKQMNGLEFSWTVFTCVFKCPLYPNDLLQIKQVNGFEFSWTVLTCFFKLSRRNLTLQIRHSIVFSCAILMFKKLLAQINTSGIFVSKENSVWILFNVVAWKISQSCGSAFQRSIQGIQDLLCSDAARRSNQQKKLH